jgi:hypothetical protein
LLDTRSSEAKFFFSRKAAKTAKVGWTIPPHSRRDYA